MTRLARRPAAVLAAWAALLACGQAHAGPVPGRPADDRVTLVPIWKRPTVANPPDEGDTRDSKAVAWVTDLHRAAAAAARWEDRALIPPARPVVRDGVVLYASDRGLAARALVPGALFAELYQAGELLWRLDREYGLLALAAADDDRDTLNRWLRAPGAAPLADRVAHRSLAYSFVEADDLVTFVDDPGLLPNPPRAGRARRPRDEVPDRPLRGGRLLGADATCGKLTTLVGDRPDVRAATEFLRAPFAKRTEDLEPDELYFLGPALPSGGRWYLVSETDCAVRLLRLNTGRYNAIYFQDRTRTRVSRALAAGTDWQVELARAPARAGGDPRRRAHALYPVEAGGLVIAPTHLGRVVAVDARSGRECWAHEYGRPDAPRFESAAPEWVVVPPEVAGGRFVYAPADAGVLLCLGAADGRRKWSAERGDGLYPAVVGDLVLVVGRDRVRALGLADGRERWRAALPGRPCGVGAAAAEDVYLVPVADPRTGQGSVAVLDLSAGRVREVLRAGPDEPVGNLAVYGDRLVSQTFTDIAVFPLRLKD